MHPLSCSMTLTLTLPSTVRTIYLVYSGRSHCIYLGALLSKFRVSGQTCVCANRIYVQSSVYADFASKLAAKVATLKVGNGLDPESYV